VVITAEHIGKKYILRHEQSERYKTLGGTMSDFARKIANPSQLLERASKEEFWALDDVNFSVAQGDRVGIIGRNGAGKSTLLKILSRIVTPSTGRIEIVGRVASLLEVGTGFHPELSGRENIFLNGSILGMSKQEIVRKFDEIVAFAEVEKFLDTPVKRYSSGMYVRLAFAVAAHLEPEILIVDEVLAVGDLQFQKKCLSKMEDISQGEGRTILFVSHNMDAVQKLCNKGILLQKGKLMDSGDINSVIRNYLSHSESSGSFTIKAQEGPGHVYHVRIEDESGNILNEIPVGKKWRLRVSFQINKEQEHFIIGIGLQTLFGLPIRTCWASPQHIKPGKYEAVFENYDLHLSSGQYKIVVGLSDNQRTYQYLDNEVYIYISEISEYDEEHKLVNKASGLIINQMPVSIKEIHS
jgi:lipopolysaccharide transport system ATP-binding protein